MNKALPDWKMKQQKNLKEYNTTAVLYTHKNSGMEVFHLQNDDPELFCAIMFYTPPENNKGIPHILEHAVFTGSEKYDVKDPFIALSSGSVNTFFNAMTYPDKTVYPFASPLEKDFYNLFSVYLDAVFSPKLRKEAVMQEGWRFNRQDDGSLGYGGVVFNEMCGSYSMHDTIISEMSYRSVFSNVSSRFDSGGIPEDIVTLDYEELLEYYRKYYVTGNCRIFLYGALNSTEALEFIDKHVPFTRHNAFRFQLEPLQYRFKRPRYIYCPAPAESGTSLSLNFLAGKADDPADALRLEVLTEYLLGHQGAALYKPLIDSEIAEDISSAAGLEMDIREKVFSIAVCGTKDEFSIYDFKKLVFSILKEIAESGVDPEEIKKILKKIEFRKREIRGGYPTGFRLFSRCMKTWLYADDPVSPLQLDALFSGIYTQLDSDPEVYTRLLSSIVLENNHYSALTVYEHELYDPVPIVRQTETIFSDALEKIKAVEKYANSVPSEHALLSIPTLHLRDINPVLEKHNIEQTEICGCSVDFLEGETAGIIYLDFAFDCAGVAHDLLLYIPLLARMICSSASDTKTYEQLSAEINSNTGGIYSFSEACEVPDISSEEKQFLFIRLPVLRGDLNIALQLLHEILYETKIQDPKRINAILNELQSDLSNSILPSGSSYAALFGAAKLSSVMNAEEQLRGITQLQFLKKSISNREHIGNTLTELRDIVFNKQNLHLQVTALPGDMGVIRAALPDLLGKLNNRIVPKQAMLKNIYTSRYSSLVIPSPVAFTAVLGQCSKINEPFFAEQLILSHYLSNNDLWDEIRINNGAYGASASINGTEGIFSMTSFRDPHPEKSLKTYNSILEIYSQKKLPDNELDKIKITLIGNELKPLVPEEQSLLVLRRKLYKITDTLRELKLKQLAETNSEHVMKAAELLAKNLKSGMGVVMADRKKLSNVQKIYPEYAEECIEIVTNIRNNNI